MLEARRKEQREALQQKQAGRRFTLEGEAKALTARQRQAGYDLAVRQKRAGRCSGKPICRRPSGATLETSHTARRVTLTQRT